MKNSMIFMLMIGLITLGACSSNETNVKADESVTDVSNEQSVATMQEDAKVEEKTDDQQAVTMETEPVGTADGSASTGNNNKISICKNGDQVRTISVVYHRGESSTSCEVTYEKSTGVQSLWNAKSDLSYCETKAEEFIRKQEGWGWVCNNLE